MERYRQEIIDQLDLPSDTSHKDAVMAFVCAGREVARQRRARTYGLDPTASVEQIDEAQESANNASYNAHIRYLATRPPHPGELDLKIGGAALQAQLSLFGQ